MSQSHLARARNRRLDFSTLLGVSALAIVASSALGQSSPELPTASPLARVQQRVGLTDFKIEYSSPGVKDRKIWGELVPFDELWRTGANATTTLEASGEFRFGGTTVPAGTYSLLSIPGKKEWTVILNRNNKVAGTRGYEQADDVARITVKSESAPRRERLTFLFSDTTDSTSRLDLEWEKLRVSVPIEVETRAQAQANIDKTLAEAWRPHFNSARWLLDSGGDLDQALGYIDTSIGIKATWWNQWVRAQILGKLKRPADAAAAAKEARQLGQGDAIYDGFFGAAVEKALAGWEKD